VPTFSSQGCIPRSGSRLVDVGDNVALGAPRSRLPGSPPCNYQRPDRCAVEGSHVKVRIVRLPPANDGTALEIDIHSLRVGRVYDLSASAASYLVVMGFAEVELPATEYPSPPANIQHRKARLRR
jgi:hypothetical protein